MKLKLLDIVNTVLENNAMKPISKISPDMFFDKDLNMDSIMIAELTVRVEDEYGIDVFEDGMIHTIGQIIQKISSSPHE